MKPNNPVPDYYAILQVHPAAEPEVIEAAYRSLMRRYHPDALSPAQRQDMALLLRVQAINAAYDVLSDPRQRAAYDEIYARTMEPEAPADNRYQVEGLETWILQVRCGGTHNTYRMLLSRPEGSGQYPRVMGFEPVQARAQTPKTGQSLPPSTSGGLIHRTVGRIFPQKERPQAGQAGQAGPPLRFPTPQQLRDQLAKEPGLNFDDIDWNGWRCPDCNTQAKLKNGSEITWCRCGGCHRIYCAGAIRSGPQGDETRCPWCGRRAGINAPPKEGEKRDLPVGGEVNHQSGGGGQTPRLPGPRRQLPGKK